MTSEDVVIVGAGASGLLCAIEAAKRGRKVCLLEKDRKPGRKIIISGGGRCNFTNVNAAPGESYLSQNPHFCTSALSRYTPWHFIEMVERHGIAYHEKKLGQLFCDETSQQIVDMLLAECEAHGVRIRYRSEVTGIARRADGGFEVRVGEETLGAQVVVLASGGLSIPNLATDLAFRAAESLELAVVPPRAALVPFTWNNRDREQFVCLSGISIDVIATAVEGTSFREQLLFTHRGLSGPAMLQISSYWQEGEVVQINLLPDHQAEDFFAEARQERPRQTIAGYLAQHFPKRFVEQVVDRWFTDKQLGQTSNAELAQLAEAFGAWDFMPGGTEGYRTAEVTLGGISTEELSSKTFECRRIPGLYVIGEAVDVTGWLGGYNFQWAWASAWACAQSL